MLLIHNIKILINVSKIISISNKIKPYFQLDNIREHIDSLRNVYT